MLLCIFKFQSNNGAYVQTKGPWATSPTRKSKFKSINTFAHSYDYIITLILREKKPIISFLIIERSLFAKPCVLFTQGYFVPRLLEIG